MKKLLKWFRKSWLTKCDQDRVDLIYAYAISISARIDAALRTTPSQTDHSGKPKSRSKAK